MLLKDVNTTKEAVAYIDGLNDIQKTMICAKAIKRDEILNKENEILKFMQEEGRGYHVLSIIDPYAVIEAINERDEYPFTSAFCVGEVWAFTHYFCDNMEFALLHAIGCKKEGLNSKFAKYAYNMLKE